jgi:hypothetical protein
MQSLPSLTLPLTILDGLSKKLGTSFCDREDGKEREEPLELIQVHTFNILNNSEVLLMNEATIHNL